MQTLTQPHNHNVLMDLHGVLVDREHTHIPEAAE